MREGKAFDGKPHVRIACALSAAFCILGSAYGGTYWLNVHEGSASQGAATNAAMWVDSKGVPSGPNLTPLDPNSDYIVRGKTLRVGGAVRPFRGRSLQIGEGSNDGILSVYDSITIENEGVLLCRGYMGFQAPKGATVHGPLTVLPTSPGGFRFWSAYENTTNKFDGAFTCPADNGIAIGGSNCKKNVMFLFLGDNSEFKGTASIKPNNGQLLIAGFSSMSGTVSVRAEGALLTGVSPDAGTTTFAGLNLLANSILIVNGTSARSEGVFTHSHAALSVTNSLSVAAPVRVRGTRMLVPSDGQPHTFDILTAPENVALNPADFVFEETPESVQRGTFGVRQDGNRQTLTITFEPVVELVVSDNDSLSRDAQYAASAWNTATSWSDGQAVHGGAHYLVRQQQDGTAMYFRTLLQNSATFPGLSLTICANCHLRVFQSGGSALTVTNLYLQGGSFMDSGISTYPRIRGNIHVSDGETALGTFNQTMHMHSTVSGDGDILFTGPASGSSTPYGSLHLYGTNTEWYGRMRVEYVKNDPTYVKKHEKLYISDERALGGRLEAFDPFATTLRKYSRLIASKSLALTPAYNRGLFIDSVEGGVLQCDAGVTFTLSTALTLNGTMYKEGGGTLVMGNTMKFGADSSDVPTAGANLFNIITGRVTVASADAMNGLVTTVSDDATLAVRFDPDNAELLRYGIRNVKTDTPWIAPTGQLPLEVEVSDEAKAAARGKSFTIGLLTVTNTVTVVNSVRALLPDNIRSGIPSTSSEIVESEDSENGWYTFALRVWPRGFIFTIR